LVHPPKSASAAFPSEGGPMFERIGTVLKHLVRVTTVLGIMFLTALLTTFVRDDSVGLAAGIGFGLVFGVTFVYIDWAGLQH